MTKHRQTKKRSQKGGFLGLFSDGDQENIIPGSSDSGSSWLNFGSLWEKTKQTTSGLVGQANDLVGNTANAVSSSVAQGVSSASNLLNQDVPLNNNSSVAAPIAPTISQSDTSVISSNPAGGKRRSRSRSNKRSKSMKGGKNGLGISYYATPVSGLAVAKPTFWINPSGECKLTKGGSKKRRVKKTRKNPRNK
jgi:hypothetical protein